MSAVRTRWTALLVVLLLALGGLTACGGDDGGGDDSGGGDTESTVTGSSDDGSSDEGDATDDTVADDGGDEPVVGTAEGVEGYCEAVNRYIALLGESLDDPGSVDSELEQAAADMTNAIVGLGEMTPEEQARFNECQAEAASAAEDLLP